MTARPWPVDRARAWIEANVHGIGLDTGNTEMRFRTALRLGPRWAPSEIDRAVAEVYGDPPSDDDIETTGPCPACGATITSYHEFAGLLPDEYIDGRRATHSWLVCKLRAETKQAAAPTPPRPAADIAWEIVDKHCWTSVETHGSAAWDSTDRAVRELTRLIEQIRAEASAAATEQIATLRARGAKLEAAVEEARAALHAATSQLEDMQAGSGVGGPAARALLGGHIRRATEALAGHGQPLTTPPVEQREGPHCMRQANVFLTPGGVEPEEWKTK